MDGSSPGRRGPRTAPRAALALLLALASAGCGGGRERESAPAESEQADTAAARIPEPAETGVKTVSRVGLASPETVVWDSLADVYLVSNVNVLGAPRGEKGFVSRLSPDGRVEVLKWIGEGRGGVTLGAPKGMVIKGDTLFVADQGTVRAFDRATGKPLGDRAVIATRGLNDLAVAPDGTLYVSDLDGNAVYRLDAGGATPVARGSALARPNGIVADGEGLVVVPNDGDEIYRLSPYGARTPVARLPAGQLDGLLEMQDGGFLATSWQGRAVYRVSPGGRVSAVASDVTSPAQLGYDAKRRRLLIPLFENDAISLVPLDGAGRMLASAELPRRGR